MPVNLLKIVFQLEENVVEELDFSYRSVEWLALCRIAAGLKQNSSLKTLNFKFAGLNAQGLHLLSEAIKTHPSLLSLDLSHNYLGPSGANCLVEIIKKNRSIQYLNLANNWQTPKEIIKIASAVKENPVLLSVNLNYENFDVDLIGKLYGPDFFAMEINYANYAFINADDEELRKKQVKLIEDYLTRNKNKLTNDIILLAIILAQGMRQADSDFRKMNISLEIVCMIFEYFAAPCKIHPLKSNEIIFKTIMDDLVVAHRFNQSFCTFFKKPLVWCESDPFQPQPKPREAKPHIKLCRLI